MTERPRRDGEAGRRSSPAAFYDDLAASYHRLYPDWEAAIEAQAQVLEGLLASRLAGSPGPFSILDCAVGVGTQLLGLAARGHRMWGTDVSAAAVRRARAECRRRGLAAGLAVADMRALPAPNDTFDAVVCADNAVAHLYSAEDLARAWTEMARVTRPGGVVLASVRDYESARPERAPGTLPQVNDTGPGRTVAFQVWDWHRDGRHYDLEHFSLALEEGAWVVTTRRSTLHALLEGEVVAAARTAGLVDVDWSRTEHTGFFQPVLVATVPPSRTQRPLPGHASGE